MSEYIKREAIEEMIKEQFDLDDNDLRYTKQMVVDKLPSIDIVYCKDCRHADECHKSVQYTHNEPNTVTIGYSPIEWCSRGERREE